MSMGALDAYYHALSIAVPGTPLVRSPRLYRLLHGLAYQRLRKPRIGMFRADELLGWSHVPGRTFVHPSYEFRARYTIDARGRRDSGGDRSGRADVVVLGCSWAFGHGVQDDETFAARLSGDGGPVAYNYACMGYGPAHAYLQLRDRIDVDETLAPDGILYYVWVPDHLVRAWRRREWIELNAWVSPGRCSHPVFDLEAGKLYDRGLVGPADGVTDPPLLPGVVRRMEWRITVELIARMHHLATDSGRRFAVVIPVLPSTVPADESGPALSRLLAARRLPLVDLDEAQTADRPPDEELFYRFDGHPTPAWHELVARLLVARGPTPTSNVRRPEGTDDA